MATLEQLAEGIRRAHAAGDAEHVKILGEAYRQMQAGAAQSNAGVVRTPQQAADELNLPIPGTDWRTPEQPARFTSPIPGGDFMNEMARSFAENVPVIGPAVDRLAQATGAQIASAITGNTPEQAQLIRDQQRAQDQRNQPVANAAGTVAGMVGPLMALGNTKLGGQALGVTGNLPQRVVAGGLSGGTIAGADQFARTGDVDASLSALKLGAGIGAAFPMAERAFGAIARALTASDADRAAAIIASGAKRDKVDMQNIDDILAALGPDAMLADAGPNLTRQAAAVASLPGEGQTIVRDALTERALGTNARIQGDADAILGPAPVPSQLTDDIRTGQRSLSTAYTDALNNAAPSNTRALAETIDDLAQFYGVGKRKAAMDKVRNWLMETDDRGRTFLTSNPSRLFMIRNELDDMIETEVGSKLGASLTDVRQQVDDLLSFSTPDIKLVDAQYQELGRQKDAIGTGQRVLDSGREAMVPDELSAAMSAEPASELLIGPSGAPFRISQGARAEIERLIGTKANNLTALKDALKGDGSWNRERLATVFGDEKADALISVLDRERQYAATAQAVLHNSETAARAAAQKDVAPRQFGSANTSIVDLLLKIPQKVANTAANARSEQVNARIAAALSSKPGRDDIDRIIAALAADRGLLGSSAVPLLINQ